MHRQAIWRPYRDPRWISSALRSLPHRPLDLVILPDFLTAGREADRYSSSASSASSSTLSFFFACTAAALRVVLRPMGGSTSVGRSGSGVTAFCTGTSSIKSSSTREFRCGWSSTSKGRSSFSVLLTLSLIVIGRVGVLGFLAVASPSRVAAGVVSTIGESRSSDSGRFVCSTRLG
jgi:hypothetical protein